MSEKSTPPVNAPTIGMMRSLTAELTMAVNAAPMTTATARSITLPWLMKSLNSCKNFFMEALSSIVTLRLRRFVPV